MCVCVCVCACVYVCMNVCMCVNVFAKVNNRIRSEASICFGTLNRNASIRERFLKKREA